MSIFNQQNLIIILLLSSITCYLYTIYIAIIFNKKLKYLEFEKFQLEIKINWYKNQCIQNNIEILDEHNMKFEIKKDGSFINYYEYNE